VKLSLRERLQARGGTEEWLDKMSVSSFFLSAAELARQPYLAWVLDRISAVYDIPDSYSLYGLLQYAKQLDDEQWNWDWEDEPEGPKYLHEGFELLYQILIEPYYLMALTGHIQESNKSNQI